MELPGKIKLPDKAILAAAMSAGATHLLTGDIARFSNYFGKKVCGVMILPPGNYLKLRKKSGGSISGGR